ncbi:DUF3299 domain-containing protein [Blastopirellula sp. JC732]|uniref:DUF3299 domain-containing protein n=1 Tax=Blastopirellula sediminis TaxID=2894196 RepID=A0A9X1MPB9_9BACT|nr:DUF3299 domain-containing protein [Blastopirellula sediminis]MCC9606808.1 DUF3299 domain-containing protein [Blastopirellula sediminis]MCC9629895.1 DUF3299 domain-containing protein [Blastopirellula sediminis]
MWFRNSTFAILLFCVACAPTTPEGTPYSANMTGLDGDPPPVKPIEEEKPPVEEPKTEESAAVEPTSTQAGDNMPAKPEAVENALPTVGTPSPLKPSKALAIDKTLPRKPGVQDLTFDDIAFDMEKGEPFARSMLPPKIEELGNQKIRIRGYILPSFESRGIKQFVLVRDNMECCFGPGAALYDCILVEMKGDGVDFTVRPVTIEGIFEIKEYLGPDGKHLAIYRMEGESAK